MWGVWGTSSTDIADRKTYFMLNAIDLNSSRTHTFLLQFSLHSPLLFFEETAKASFYPVSFTFPKHANDSLEKSLSCNWYRHSFIYCEPTNSKLSFSLSSCVVFVCLPLQAIRYMLLAENIAFRLYLSYLISSMEVFPAANAAKFIWLSAHTRSNRVHLIWYSVSTHTTWEIRCANTH